MLRFADGGGRSYGTAGTSNVNILAHWTVANTNLNTWSVQSGGGRTTGSSLRTNNYSGFTYLQKNLDAQSTWGAAVAIKFSSIYTNTPTIISFLTSGATVHVDLRLTPLGALQFTRNNGTNIGSVSSVILSPNVWYHIEVKVSIHTTAGTVECRVNGVPVIGPTGSLNTTNGSGTTANCFALGNFQNIGGGSVTTDYDDIIVYDGQATDANGNADINDFIGDCGVTVLSPSGAGTTTQFTPDSAVANYTRVNESTPDTTSYVESSTVGQKDTYPLSDLPATITAIKSIATLHYAEKTDVGSRQIGAVLRSGGTDYVHPTGIDLSNSYIYYFRNWGRNPNTAAAWTPANINALEEGQVVNS
jgi:hypothetical protein